MADDKLLLLGCGILKKEIQYLIEKNSWQIDNVFLDSALHVDFDKLSSKLKYQLNKYSDRNTIVFYGCCHPLMDNMLDDAKTIRTLGQNCIDILLGTEVFMEELTNGAFFLLEDWAKRWNYVITKTFGDKPEIIREIFQVDRKYILCLRTPCSGEFSELAKEASVMVGLPLRWLDVSLDHLELVLQETINRKMGKI